eukprot:jgi/Mesvir1/22377/Mv17872-RA.4
MERLEPSTPRPGSFFPLKNVNSRQSSTDVVDYAEKDNGRPKRWAGLSHGFISHRLVVLRARLVLLLLISAVIMLTAALTWKIAIDATNDSFNGMSAQLREDITLGAVNELKGMLNSFLQAMNSMRLALQAPNLAGQMPVFDREELSGPVLTAMWSVFSSYQDITATSVISAQNLIAAYRRNGPEGTLLESPIGVGVPPPSNDTLNAIYMYVPNATTGLPLLDGKMGKFCLVDRCPAPLNRSVYVQPFPQPLNHPGFLMGKDLPDKKLLWTANIDGGMQPYLFVASAIKDAQGKTAAVAFFTASSSRLQPILQSTSLVQHYGGRMLITVGKNLNMLTASTGTLFLAPAVLGGNPRFISATNSSDDIIRAAATHLNDTYASSIFLEHIKDIIWVHGHGLYYVNSIPMQHEGLQLVVILVVPRESVRGEIDHSYRKGLLIAMGIAMALFVVGGLIMCLSTISLSQFLALQGKKLDHAAAANEALAQRLAILTSDTSLESPAWPRVDMGTPLEKLTIIFKSLRRGHLMTQAQIDEIHELLSSEDLHRPEFLASLNRTQHAREQGHRGVPGAIDTQTGQWIEIMATGRRMSIGLERAGSMQTGMRGVGSAIGHPPPRSRRNSSFEASRTDSLEASSHGDSVGRSYLASTHSCDVTVTERTASSGRYVADAGTPVMSQIIPAMGLQKACQCQLGALPALSMRGDGEFLDGGSAKSLRLLSQPAPCIEDQAVGQLQSIAALAVLPTWGGTPGHIPAEGAMALLMSPDGSTLAVTKLDGNGKGQHGLEAVIAAERLKAQVKLLREVGGWGFDTLALQKVAPDRVVPLVGFVLFTKMGLIDKFSINENKLANFLHQIGRGMGDHPYHNAAHVSDVTASLFHLLSESGISDSIQPLDKLAATCAALVHDYKHPGVNNDFLKRTREELATIYNDQSPLENFHLAEAFQLLYSHKNCNFLKKLSYTQFMEVRHVIIEMVLASDIKRHFGVLDQFKARVSQETPWDMHKESDRVLLLQMALKVADLGHAAKTLPLHLEWSHRVTEEFYKQGDAERKLELDVSPFMDRSNNNVPRSQLGFFQFLALPLFEAWVKAFPNSAHLVANAMVNIAHWKQELQAMEYKSLINARAKQ